VRINLILFLKFMRCTYYVKYNILLLNKIINNNRKDYNYNNDNTNATNKHKRSNNKIECAQVLRCEATKTLNNAINY